MIKKRKIQSSIRIDDLFNNMGIPNKENASLNLPFDLHVKTPFGYNKIKTLFRTEKQQSVRLYFANNKTLEVGLDHLLKVNGEWQKIKDIKVNNDIIETENGYTTVKKIKYKKEKILYDMSVDKVHCYYSNNILSHNSWFLAKIGNHMVSQGKTVFHYTLELSDIMIAKRHYSIFTGIAGNRLIEKKDELIHKLDTIVKNTNGKLIIKEYPTKRATIDTISAHLDTSINNGIKPDAIIIDYGDLIKPIKSSGEKRLDIGSVFEDLRGLAGQYEVPVITASQSNRAGATVDIIDGEHVSEDWSKIMTGDFIMSLSRKTEDSVNQTARAYIIKNRFGPDKMIFPCSFNLDNGDLRIFDASSTQGIVLNNNMNSADDIIKKKIKNKYFDD